MSGEVVKVEVLKEGSDVVKEVVRSKGRPCKGVRKLTEDERREAKRISNERYYERNREKIKENMKMRYNEDVELSRIKAREKSDRYYKAHKEDVKLIQSVYYYKKVYEKDDLKN
jgi:hypothetical protein